MAFSRSATQTKLIMCFGGVPQLGDGLKTFDSDVEVAAFLDANPEYAGSQWEFIEITVAGFSDA